MTITIPIPTITIPIPTVTVEVPTVTVQIPTVTVEVPTVTVQIPTITVPIPSVTAPLPTMTALTPVATSTPNASPTRPSSTNTPPAGSTARIHVCGRVTSYTAATLVSTGLLVIDGRPLVLGLGTLIEDEHLLTAGSDICLTAWVNLAGQITAGSITARATGTVSFCGRVTAYQAATGRAAGMLRLGDRTLAIAPGAHLDGEELLAVGNDVCLSATLDASGRINSGAASADVGAGAQVSACGRVDAFQAATATVPGLIRIAGQEFVIAAGTHLVGQERLRSGDQACLRGRVKADGELSDGSLTFDSGTSMEVCGRVDAFQAATATVPGSLTINGQPLMIAAGTTLEGQDLLQAGANICLRAAVNAAGQITGGAVRLNGNGSVGVNVCGTVTYFQAATSTTPGAISIGGQRISIAAGTTLVGQDAVEVGANHCLSGHLDAMGQLQDGTIAGSIGGSLRICGTVQSYQAATATSAGWLRLNDRDLIIAPNASLMGAALLREGADICVTATLDASGRIQDGSVSGGGSVSGSVELCGSVTAFQAASASTPGSLTIGGQTLAIAAGTHLTGEDLVRLGADYCLSAQLDAAGRIKDGTIEVSTGAEVHLCGVVTAFQAARATSPGSITIGGQTIAISVGTTLAGQDLLRIGNRFCLDAVTDATGRIADGSISADGGLQARVNVCGQVTVFQAATATADGLLTIAGRNLTIAAGTRLVGQDDVRVGSSFCLDATLDVDGKVTDGSISASGRARLCGVVTAMANGKVTLEGVTLALATDAEVELGVGVCVAVCAEIGADGKVVRLMVNAAASVRGMVTAYEAGRFIALDGRIFALAEGARLGANLRVGSRVQVTLNGAREVVCVLPEVPGVTPGTPGTPGTAAPPILTSTPRATVTPGGPTPAPTPVPGRATICGVVYDARTMAPLGGATVELFRGADIAPMMLRRTAPNGAYCFYDLTPGTYTLVGTHPRYDPDMKTVTLPPDRITMVDLYLTPRPGSGPGPTSTPGTPPPARTPPPAPTPRPTGRPPAGPGPGVLCPFVFRASTGMPIAGAIVEVFDDDGTMLARGSTGIDGHRCFNLPAGPVIVVARVSECAGPPRCASKLAHAEVVANEVRRVDLPLECRDLVPIYLPYIAQWDLTLSAGR